MSPTIHSAASVISVALLAVTSEAFLAPNGGRGAHSVARVTPTPWSRANPGILPTSTTNVVSQPQMSLFNRGNGDNNNGDGDAPETSGEGKRRLRVPFFGRSAASEDVVTATTAAEDTDAPTAVKEEEKEEEEVPATNVAAVAEKRETKPPSALETAKSLRAQAERARLEAERMDAELTLSKIEKLEQLLATAKAKGESVEDLQFQMDNLQARLRGEAPKPKLTQKPVKNETIATGAAAAAESNPVDKRSARIEFSKDDGTLMKVADYTSTYASLDVKESAKMIEQTPTFMQRFMAMLVDLEVESAVQPNATEIATRIKKMAQADFSFFGVPEPTFTPAQIQEEIDRIKATDKDDLGYPPTFFTLAGGNETQLAIYGLEFDYYTDKRMLNNGSMSDDAVQTIIEDDEILKQFISLANFSVVDVAFESLYPKCIRKEGTAPSMESIQKLVSSVLPAAKFVTTASPDQVSGGFIVRGKHKYENGDDLIRAIDEQLERFSLQDSMTVLYAPDYSAAAKLEENDFDEFDLSDEPPILYVVAADITREPRRTFLSIASAAGLATSWYLAIYPFLLNPTLAKRIDEQLALADASMQFDLDWLTDFSVPLFFVFIGIQLAHEAAHTAVAGFYNFTTTFPTFVPSLITGITGTVTSFKKPPPNNEAMFDFSVAGPLVGMVASIVALAVGTQLTLASDPSTLPALPLEILRQSTLGGGIINAILGNGVLSLPSGATGSQIAAGMVIPLHPIAIAGYISLFVNALAVLPVGTTDGGRMVLSLFGRTAKGAIGNLALLGLLLCGLTGSDLFLFYFSFVIAFQTGNEIPARNEMSKLGLPRFTAALSAWFLAALVLVPFQELQI